MPPLSRWMLRGACLHFVVGWSLGTWLLVQKGAATGALLWSLLPAHIDLLLFGFMTQLAFATAYWILPRKQGRRGRPVAAGVAFVFVNFGPVLVAAAAWLPQHAVWIAVGRSVELAAFVAFGWHLWPRLQPLTPRRRQGVR